MENKYTIELSSQGGHKFMDIQENGYRDVSFIVRDYERDLEKAKRRIEWLKANEQTTKDIYESGNRKIQLNKRGDHAYIVLVEDYEIKTFNICFIGEDLKPIMGLTYEEAVEQAMNYKFPKTEKITIYETV